jgi:hypothetical protein
MAAQRGTALFEEDAISSESDAEPGIHVNEEYARRFEVRRCALLGGMSPLLSR